MKRPDVTKRNILNNPMKNKEAIEKMRLTKIGKPLSREHAIKISLALKGKTPKNFETIKGWNKGRISKVKSNYTYVSHKSWCSEPKNLSYVPKGFIIHHIDFNPQNNNQNNLFIMDRKSHVQHHMAISKLICKELTP